MEFQVEWKGYRLCNAVDEWVKEADLACEAKVCGSTPTHILSWLSLVTGRGSWQFMMPCSELTSILQG